MRWNCQSKFSTTDKLTRAELEEASTIIDKLKQDINTSKKFHQALASMLKLQD